MYEIQKAHVGTVTVYNLRFSGYIDEAEMTRWAEDSAKALASAPREFCVRVDMRGLKPLAPETQQIMEKGQAEFKKRGMVRSAVLLDNALLKLQFERLAKQSGIHAWERYFSEKEPGYDTAIEHWIAKAA